MTGEFEISTDKEAFFNCAFIAALAKGNTIIHNVKSSPLLEGCPELAEGRGVFREKNFTEYLRSLGAEISVNGNEWEIVGVNFKFEQAPDLDWIGDDFPHQRRNRKIIESLLKGVPFNFEEKIPVKDSLIRELLSFGAELQWFQDGPDESDELAKRMARLQGKKAERKWICKIPAIPSLFARDRFVAGDVSEAAYLALAASLIPDSDIIIKSVNLDSTRAGVFGVFKRLGADIEVISRHERGNDVWGDLRVRTAKMLVGRRLSPEVLSTSLDELPFLAVLACFAEGETTFKLPLWAVDFYKPLLIAIYENLKIAGIESGFYEEGFILRGREEIEADGFNAKGFQNLGYALQVLSKKAKAKNEVKEFKDEYRHGI